jgi:hypothetical protein
MGEFSNAVMFTRWLTAGRIAAARLTPGRMTAARLTAGRMLLVLKSDHRCVF